MTSVINVIDISHFKFYAKIYVAFSEVHSELPTLNDVFWALMFPIFLGTMFYFMFGNIDVENQFTKIPIGLYIEKENKIFMEMPESVRTDNDEPMFEIHMYDTLDDAYEALKNKDISGYVILKGDSPIDAMPVDDEFELVVTDMDISTTVIKTFIDQYIQNNSLITKVALEKHDKVTELITGLYDNDIEIKDIPLKSEDKSPYTRYFFALIAMTCLIASQFGLENGVAIQADLSPVGARRNMAPTPKLSQVVCDFLATYTIYSTMLLIVLAVTIFVFKQDFGTNTGLIVLNTLAGNFTGEAAGRYIPARYFILL